ncbi:MAG TPA: hypothetical protein VHS31_01045 [Tepidisphaeraceae bacterium]|jgi:hypothetical protein|nr:hypothetical protein [Tepidisphaeraceae bacterium]
MFFTHSRWDQLTLALTTKWQHQLLEDQKRDEMQQWLNELTEMVGSAKGETVSTPAQSR